MGSLHTPSTNNNQNHTIILNEITMNQYALIYVSKFKDLR